MECSNFERGTSSQTGSGKYYNGDGSNNRLTYTSSSIESNYCDNDGSIESNYCGNDGNDSPIQPTTKKKKQCALFNDDGSSSLFLFSGDVASSRGNRYDYFESKQGSTSSQTGSGKYYSNNSSNFGNFESNSNGADDNADDDGSANSRNDNFQSSRNDEQIFIAIVLVLWYGNNSEKLELAPSPKKNKGIQSPTS